MDPSWNSTRPLESSPPFLWPDARALVGQRGYATEPPILDIASESTSTYGQIHGIAGEATQRLIKLATERPDRTMRLVIVVYPATETREEHLRALLDLQEEYGQHVQFRLMATDSFRNAPANVVCCYSLDRTTPIMMMGPSVSFEITQPACVQLNAIFRADAVLAEQWRKWFDWRWTTAAPLSNVSCSIPALMLKPSDAGATQLWSDYVSTLRTQVEPSDREMVSVDDETGEVSAVDSDGRTAPTVSERDGLAKLDAVAEQVARLIEKGQLVTIDKSTRMPPLDAPIKAEWFGVESLRTEGAVTREVRYRISVINDKTLKAIEAKRTKTRELLAIFSFPLADGVRWIPHEAKALFEAEQDRINEEGSTLLVSTIGDDVASFVEGQRHRITEDANQMYRDFHSNSTLPSRVIDEILANLKSRLDAALHGTFLPRVTYTNVHFVAAGEAKWTSEWGQAQHLLEGIAKFPRRLLSDRYFMRGMKTPEEKAIAAMDVCGDAICLDIDNRSVIQRAEDELRFIKYIVDSHASSRKRCKAMLDLMAGHSTEEIATQLDNIDDESGD